MTITKAFAASALVALATAAAAALAAAEPATMKIGTATINDTQHEWMKRFKAKMDAVAADTIKVELYPQSQLGGIPRMVEGMQLGTIESFVTPSAFLVGVDQRNQVLTAAGLFKDIPNCWKTVRSQEFRDLIFPMLESKGIGAISIICTAPQAFLTKKEIKRLDDFGGLKIRVLATDLEIKPMRAVGINPTPMDFGEVLPALQQNVIDGLSSIPILFNTMKMYTVAKNITLTGLINWSVPVYVSKPWWDKLPAELRATILSQAKAVEAELIEWNDKANEDTIKAWKDNGGTVDRLPDADQLRLLDAIKPVVAQVLAERQPVNELFEKVSALAKANE